MVTTAVRSCTCSCVGRSGKHKARWLRRQDAVDAAISRGWVPATYRCPNGDGYHLTHDRRRR